MELLVVIGVIGILAALLLPALNLARDKGRAAVCLSNLKQLYVALSMYADDNNERYPFASSTVYWDQVSAEGTAGWMQAIQPYLQSTKVLKCPSDSTSSFSYFLGTRAAFIAMGGRASVVRSAIDRPDAYVLAGDTFSQGSGMFDPLDCDKDDYSVNCAGGPEGGSPHLEWRRHGGAQNILFGDGHAGTYPKYNPEEMTFRYYGVQPW